MEFEWDNYKNQSNYDKHKISFDVAVDIFKTPCVTYEDKRRNYGEGRFIALGEIQGLVLFLVYTKRKNKIRVISARRANKKERDEYHDSIKR